MATVGWLRRALAGRLAPYHFYVVHAAAAAADDHAIGRVSWREALAYVLRTGRLPRDPRVTLVSSGGAGKGYFALGVFEELIRQGVEIEEYFVTSVSAFLAVYRHTGDLDAFREFAIEIPDLIEPRRQPGWVGPLKATLNRPLRRVVDMGARLYNAHTLDREVELDGGVARLNRGMVDPSRLRERLQQIFGDTTMRELKGFHIVATDITPGTERDVVFGIDFPDIPVREAVMASLSLPEVFPPVYYDRHVFWDGGVSYRVPVLSDRIDARSKTILILNLLQAPTSPVVEPGREGPPVTLDLTGTKGMQFSYLKQREIYERVLLRHLVPGLAKAPLERIAEFGDVEGHRVYYMNAYVRGVAPYDVRPALEVRLDLIREGNAFGRELCRNLRRPLFHVRRTDAELAAPGDAPAAQATV